MTAALFFSAGYVVHIDCPVHAVDVFHVLGQQEGGEDAEDGSEMNDEHSGGGWAN